MRALVVVSLLVATAACSRPKHEPPEEGWLSPRPAPALRGLAVVRGEPFELRQHRGHVVLVSFGYTNCAEICPETFSTVKAVLRDLGDSSKDVELVYVTVDPDRDRPDEFRAFMKSVDPRFEGLYAQGDDLQRMLDDYRVTVRKRLPEPGHERFYAMDHTAGFWGIDRHGDLRFRLAHDATSDEVRDATKRLLAEPTS